VSARSNVEIQTAERTLILTRVFDAPRALVFKVWSDPQHLAKWWGPRGFTVLSCKADVRPGGAYRFHTRSPQGTEHWLAGIYREIVEPERLDFTYAWLHPDGTPKHEMLVELSFREKGEKTELTLRQSNFESVTARDLHREGWTSTLDVLGEYLAETAQRA
jgi:uncharacterized protein YndB with AHSA1/START domain